MVILSSESQNNIAGFVVVVVIDMSPASISLGEALALVSTTRFFLNILCIC